MLNEVVLRVVHPHLHITATSSLIVFVLINCAFQASWWTLLHAVAYLLDDWSEISGIVALLQLLTAEIKPAE